MILSNGLGKALQHFNTCEFEKTLKDRAYQIELHLNKLIPPKPNTIEETITETMRYALLNGGKKVRAYLSMESCRIYGINIKTALQVGSAIECMHSYSLVHDDLPAMDNDELRRGLPTVHVKWDEATAILTGDALQCKAFEILSMEETHSDSDKRSKLIQTMALAAGVDGMVSGQNADIQAENQTNHINIDGIVNLQNYKTGALIRWSALTGPLLANQDHTIMETYANCLGLAFQIQDDILDVEGNVNNTGKMTHKDQKAGKGTFISILGLDEAKRKAYSLIEQSCDVVTQIGPRSSELIKLALFVISRNN